MIPWIVRERLAGAAFDEFLEFTDEYLEVVGGEVRVLGVCIAEQFLFDLLDHQLEWLLVLGGEFLHTHDHVTVHLNEPAVAVPSEAWITAGFSERIHGLVVETKVKDGVHHARHGLASTGANGKQKRVALVAELLAELFLHQFHSIFHLRLKHLGIGALVGVVIGADLRGDGETRRHRQADAGHLCEVRPLTAEQFLHFPVAIGFFAEVIDVLSSLLCCHKLCFVSWECREIRQKSAEISKGGNGVNAISRFIYHQNPLGKVLS